MRQLPLLCLVSPSNDDIVGTTLAKLSLGQDSLSLIFDFVRSNHIIKKAIEDVDKVTCVLMADLRGDHRRCAGLRLRTHLSACIMILSAQLETQQPSSS